MMMMVRIVIDGAAVVWVRGKWEKAMTRSFLSCLLVPSSLQVFLSYFFVLFFGPSWSLQVFFVVLSCLCLCVSHCRVSYTDTDTDTDTDTIRQQQCISHYPFPLSCARALPISRSLSLSRARALSLTHTPPPPQPPPPHASFFLLSLPVSVYSCTRTHAELREAAYGDADTFLRIAEDLALKKAHEVCA